MARFGRSYVKPIVLARPMGAQAYIQIAEQENYTLSGQDVSFLATRILAAENGNYALVGQDAGTLKGFYLQIEHGTYALLGQDVIQNKGFTLDAVQGVYNLNGQAVTFGVTRQHPAEQGTYLYTGQAVDLRRTARLVVGLGEYGIVGSNVELVTGEMPPPPAPLPEEPPVRPLTFPPVNTLDELRMAVERAFEELMRQNSELKSLELRPLYREPARPRPGMIVSADGVEWDPGSGEGTYMYTSGGTWVKL